MNTDDPGLSELEKTVGALARTLDRALRKVDRLDTKLTALADGIEEGAAPPPAGTPEGPAGPGVRSWLLADDPAQAAADLDDLTAWVWRVYLWWPEAWLSSCWLWHPEVVEELWWLRVAHTDAYDPETGTSLRVADWHDRLRPGVARRVRGIVGKCELNRHIPYNGRPVEITPPGPPALARHATAVAAVWSAGAGLDVVRAAGPEPTPKQLAEADAFQNALYRSRR
jgi:hypothetical protein